MDLGEDIPEAVHIKFQDKLKQITLSFEQKLKNLRPIIMQEASAFVKE